MRQIRSHIMTDQFGTGTRWCVFNVFNFFSLGRTEQVGIDGILTEGEALRIAKEWDERDALMKAAPDMLAALQMLLKAYESLMPGIKYIAVQDYALINDAPIAATKAIHKATTIE